MESTPYGIAPPGHRLPPTTRVGRVRLQIADLQRSLEYYTGVLGMRPLEVTGREAVLVAHGDNQPLVELRERAGAHRVPRRGLLGLYHFAILLPDRMALGRFVQHLADRGVHAGSADHAVSEAIYLTDPDGLGIEVYADRPRSAWRVNGQQLYMTTEPLDLRDLVRAAGGASWTGIPAGTRMGHVHLFVGALEQAESFYHAALGLDKIGWSYPGALFLSAGGYHHHLGTNTWAAGARSATDEAARLLEWELLVPHPEAAGRTARSIADAGYAVAADGADHVTTDPWGTTLRVRPLDAGHL